MEIGAGCPTTWRRGSALSVVHPLRFEKYPTSLIGKRYERNTGLTQRLPGCAETDEHPWHPPPTANRDGGTRKPDYCRVEEPNAGPPPSGRAPSIGNTVLRHTGVAIGAPHIAATATEALGALETVRAHETFAIIVAAARSGAKGLARAQGVGITGSTRVLGACLTCGHEAAHGAGFVHPAVSPGALGI